MKHNHKKEHGEQTCACGCGHGQEHKNEHEHEHEHETCHCHENGDDGCGCGCHHDHGHEHDERKAWQKVLGYVFGGCVTAIGFLPLLPVPIRMIASLVAYVGFGFSVFRDMIAGFSHKKIFTEFTLMCVASLGAFAIGEYADAAAVMYLYRLGEEISGGAYARSRRNLSELLAVTPDHANVLRDGEVHAVEPHEVTVGERILVRVGERIPLDGTVLEGGGSADTSSVTGEAMPLMLYEGIACPSGSVLTEGSVTLLVTHAYEDSVISKLAEAVREATARKSSAEKKIARFARIFTPAAFAVAALISLIGTLITGELAHWVRMGLTVLVISCPCSLVLSVPLAYFAGIGAAAKRGIVFRGGEIMDRMSRLSVLGFDKTGTLTESELSFDGATLLGTMAEKAFLQLSYDVLLHSPHAAAVSFCQGFDGVAHTTVTEIEIVGGRGISCLVGDKRALFGNAVFLREHGMDVADSPTTAIFGALDGEVLGKLNFSAHTKAHVEEAVAELRTLGVSRLAVLSGDGEVAVAEACRNVGVAEWASALTPKDKLDRLERMMAETDGVVGFCGDGLNDSAVIARADVGIAMGACGSALTVQSADVVIMDDDLAKIAEGMRIARKTERVANISIALSLGMKLAVVIIGLVLSGFGRSMPIELAIVADVGAAVVAVLQSMRAAKHKTKA